MLYSGSLLWQAENIFDHCHTKQKSHRLLHFCINDGFVLERPTRLELATSTLAKVALYQMSYGRISGAFIPAPSRAILANFGAPAEVCEAKFCEEEEKVLHDFRRGASDRNRTNDTGIFSPLLYRLSYRGKYDPDRARTDDPQRDRLVL